MTFTELLPATKSEPHGAITWAPATDNAMSSVAGLLTITGKRCHGSYRVTEFPTGWDGRGFYLEKAETGLECASEGYSVMIARNGQDKLCQCKGFTFAGHCKHLSALEALIENGQL